ncbi:MAG TPA: hypothetical protein VKU19_06935 [Bryobacteraceae bacterium]|nr:hypothetical protein [Bryobacteraceae bacterium]
MIRKIATVIIILAATLSAQAPHTTAGNVIEQPDAQRTKDELSNLLGHYPPALRGALALDSSLLTNQSYLAPYPALVSFLSTHPDVERNPSYYLSDGRPGSQDHGAPSSEVWREVVNALEAFAGFGLAIGVSVWLIRTIIDYRRWSRLAKVQAEVHAKLLDRFTANNDLLAYMQTPAGAKFLESTPITLDSGPRSVGAPLSRILWSVQGGLVLVAGGVGLEVVSSRFSDDSSQPLHALGVLGIALGLGFVISAIVSYMISHRLGLIETPPSASRIDPAGVEGFGFRK